MPKPKRKHPKTVYSSLSPEDFSKFSEMADQKQITQAELFREAIMFYIEHQDRLQSEEKDSKLESRLRKMEERLAGLLARTAIDVGVVYNMVWRNMPEAEREKTFKSAYRQAVERIKQKLTDDDKAVRDMVK